MFAQKAAKAPARIAASATNKLPSQFETRQVNPPDRGSVSWNFADIAVFHPELATHPTALPPSIAPGSLGVEPPIGQAEGSREHAADPIAAKVAHIPEPESNAAAISSDAGCKDTAIGAPGMLKPVLRSSGQPLDSHTRIEMQTQFSFDFSNVRIHNDDAAHRTAATLGVLAYAWGKDVGFANGVYPGGSDGRRLLAHELAHVVQQQSGETRSLASGSQGERTRLEQQAETSARDVVGGNKLSQRSTVGLPAPVLQGFDPQYHEEAVVEGLSGTFTPEEIGKIYEGNWRRDYSQASPELADIALTWKELKDASTPEDKHALQAKLALRIGAMVKIQESVTGETYGGYRTWEHMDNPGDPAATEAESRWSGSRPGDSVAGYIQDSRAYIKQNLVQAVGIARQGWNPPDQEYGRRIADAWAKGTPPQDYDVADSYAGRSRPPAGLGTPKDVNNPRESSSVVASDVTSIANKQSNVTTVGAKGFTTDPQIADNLGRASHALEDFFAHSNFVELSRKHEPINPKDLKTGTFGLGDKAHSLADKIGGIVTEIRAHRDLIPAIVLPDVTLSGFAAIGVAFDATAAWTAGKNAGSHTALNKDEPTRPNFAIAHQLAVAADRLVFESIHRAMQASLPEASSQIVYDTYALIDALVNVPSEAHPLKAIYSRP